tara:strand:- start:2198 stop:2416 length:219 start_codon:yes stop_codon:yes gene_type:complete
MKNKSRYPDRRGLSAYGGDPNNVVNAGGCSSYERAYCIQTRAENEPETLMTDTPGVLVCPACGFKLNWRNEE